MYNHTSNYLSYNNTVSDNMKFIVFQVSSNKIPIQYECFAWN